MYLHGSFINRRGETVKVEILTARDRSQSIEICKGAPVVFPADPVEIRCESDATAAHLVRSSASIRLLTRGYMPELYSASALDGVVNIHVGGICVFAGFILPQSYSQSFANVYDEYELNCIDVLSALQNLKYRGIGSARVNYDAVKSMASQRTFGDIIEDIIKGVTRNLDISGIITPIVSFDNSLSAMGTDKPLFTDVAVSELLFLGDTETDVWTQQEVVEEIMRYLNLLMVQDGFNFRIFSPDSLRDREAISWTTLTGGASGVTVIKDITISSAIAMDTDASISIGEVYNRIELTCDVTEMENLIESPLDSGSMKSPYTNKQLYVTEYSLEGGKVNDASFVVPAFKDLVEKGTRKADMKGGITDWYVQVYDSMNWNFTLKGADGSELTSYALAYMQRNEHQEFVPDYLSRVRGAWLLSFGKAERAVDPKDNSMTGRIDMTDYLAIAVNGNGKDMQTETYPTESSLLDAAPLAEYIGQISGGVFSPGDDETTNYIVFSGTMVLNPLFKQVIEPQKVPWISGKWENLEDNPDNPILGTAFKVPAKDYENGRLYLTKWYASDYPGAQEQVVIGPGLMPYTGELVEEYEYKYSAIGDGSDTISKIGMVACMLIIGDKCVVETGSDGKTTDFEWRPYKTRQECADDDEYYAQSFTLGFDPKIGDKLVGTEFDLQNNIDYRMGLDMEGTAIPIRRSDRVTGSVTFRILGPVNTLWDEITRRHKTWFRKAKWSSTSVPLLAHVSTIYIKDFEVKVCTDNGLINNADNSDLVYVSDTDESFVNVKDDITFKITTALTREERMQLSVSDSVKLSAPALATADTALLGVVNNITGSAGKPEQLYVDSMYREYHLPRITMMHKLRSSSGVASMFNRFIHPALPGKEFRVCGISRGLSEGWDEVTLKEIADD